MRFFIELSYDGSQFFGWQVQPDKTTVQGELNQWLSQLLQEEINVVGCGRTDAGVHAKQYFAHFDCEKQPYENLAYKLNSVLPETIAIQQIFKVEDEQHSRFDANLRAYTYYIHFDKNPFLRHFSYQCFYKDLDIDLMQKVASSLVNYKDFEPLSKASEDVNHSFCDIYSSSLIKKETENGLQLELTISANRFLHNMIRRIVGLLINVGRGKITEQEVVEVLTNGGQFSENFVAPPQGLHLIKVDYPFLTLQANE